MAYNVSYKASVKKDLGKISKAEARRILDQIDRRLPLKADACPVLKGEFAGFRKFRVGDYRVIFAILKEAVLVLKVGHRKDVFR